jgi:hypothetical protein
MTLGLMLSLALAACNNNDNVTTESQQMQEESTGQNQEYAEIGSGAHLVEFPENLEEGIVFATYDRGDIHENIYVNSREAIEAAQNGEEFPSGTVITLEGFRNGELEHYLVMEKQTGWGSQYSPDERTGEWEFQAFTPDRKVMEDGIGGEALGRCYSCHANQERDQYMNSMDQMKEFNLEEVSQINRDSQITGIVTEGWHISVAHMNDSINVNKIESGLIGDEKKAKIIQNVLLTMYLQHYKS